MKFLCPSCKAKYQISDEKVAGRSVRMKCRKCGHVIQISKTITEGAGGSEPPGGSSYPPASDPLSQNPPSSSVGAAGSPKPGPIATTSARAIIAATSS